LGSLRKAVDDFEEALKVRERRREGGREGGREGRKAR